ncbi:hypothetical protein [Paraglaciecola aestuariivivens]
MTGKRFLNFLAHKGIPASCFAQRLGCKLSAIQNLQHCDTVPKHYINMLIKEFGHYLQGSDIERMSAH